jgi:hypothetical protein
MAGPLLYSTNVFLKYQIQKQYFGDIHYVWCSEVFDWSTHGSVGSMVGASSNPADIYRQLKNAIKTKDSHDWKINQQKTSMVARFEKLHNLGTINDQTKDDLLYILKNATFPDFEPLIYIIPRVMVSTKLQVVPANLRASLFGIEYIITDLLGDEFDFVRL